MSKSYPDTVPHPHSSHEDLARAYRMGWDHGHGLACHNVPELGKTYWTDADGRVTADAIFADLAEYDDDDYGIEAEDDSAV
jgi:hypothetical protein